MTIRRYRVPSTSQAGGWLPLRDARHALGFSRGYLFHHVSDGGTYTEATKQGSPATLGTVYGMAGDFDGSAAGWYTNQVITDSPAEFTMLALVRPDVADSTDRTILSLSNTADDVVLCRLFVVSSGNVYGFQVRANDGSVQTVTAGTAAAGTPAVVGCVYRSGNGERSAWTDGTKGTTDTATGVGGPITFNTTSIGFLRRSSNIHWFDGQIIEAHILPWAFSDSEMRQATQTPAALFRKIYANRVRSHLLPSVGGGGVVGPLIGRGRLTHSPLIAGRLVQ